MSEKMRNRGVVKVSLGLLGQMMHLPEGHNILAVRQADDFSESFDILVEGPDLPLVGEGDLTPRVQFQVTVSETEEVVRSRNYTGQFVS